MTWPINDRRIVHARGSSRGHHRGTAAFDAYIHRSPGLTGGFWKFCDDTRVGQGTGVRRPGDAAPSRPATLGWHWTGSAHAGAIMPFVIEEGCRGARRSSHTTSWRIGRAGDHRRPACSMMGRALSIRGAKSRRNVDEAEVAQSVRRTAGSIERLRDEATASRRRLGRDSRDPHRLSITVDGTLIARKGTRSTAR